MALKPINKAREQRQHDKAVDAERQRLEAYEDLRDDVVSLVKNSHLTFEDIHGKLGPHPSTLTKWAEKTTHAPRLGKMQATLRIIGYDIGVIPHQRERLEITKFKVGADDAAQTGDRQTGGE
jgi:hypothetical protein